MLETYDLNLMLTNPVGTALCLIVALDNYAAGLLCLEVTEGPISLFNVSLSSKLHIRSVFYWPFLRI